MKKDDERRKKRMIGSFKKGREVEVICFFRERMKIETTIFREECFGPWERAASRRAIATRMFEPCGTALGVG